MVHDDSVALIRSETLATATALGYATNPRLPLLDRTDSLRAQEEAAARSLCLLAVSACAFGFSSEIAQRWITTEGLAGSLTSAECDLLRGRRRATVDDRYQVEAIWALLWSLSLAPALDFAQPCPDTTVRLLPDLRVAEPADKFKTTCHLRDPGQLLRALDLAYMIHWSVVDESLRNRQHTGALSVLAIRHRRHALEWLASSESWDQIELDT